MLLQIGIKRAVLDAALRQMQQSLSLEGSWTCLTAYGYLCV